MTIMYKLFKKILFLLFFGIDIDDINYINAVDDVNTFNSINDVNTFNSINDVNTFNSINDVNTFNSINDVNTVNSINDVNTVDADVSTDKNSQNNSEKDKTILKYLKLAMITCFSLLGLIILINLLNFYYESNLEELQNLLNELVRTVDCDWTVYEYIFENIEKLLSSSAEKSKVLSILRGIHFFLLKNDLKVHDLEKFDKVMKKIIDFLNDNF